VEVKKLNTAVTRLVYVKQMSLLISVSFLIMLTVLLSKNSTFNLSFVGRVGQ
jgi:hypothetical protein